MLNAYPCPQWRKRLPAQWGEACLEARLQAQRAGLEEGSDPESQPGEARVDGPCIGKTDLGAHGEVDARPGRCRRDAQGARERHEQSFHSHPLFVKNSVMKSLVSARWAAAEMAGVPSPSCGP